MSVPSHNTVLLWVRNFSETESTVKRKPPGRQPSLRIPDNIERVRHAFVRSPRRSANRNAIALRMSNRTVRRILLEHLNFTSLQSGYGSSNKWSRHCKTQKNVCEVLLNALDNDDLNPLNPELNPICYLLALLGAHHFLHVSRIRVKLLTFGLLMSYIYGVPILNVSRSHTTTQHSR